MFAVLCIATSWNQENWGSDDNVSMQQRIFHSLFSLSKSLVPISFLGYFGHIVGRERDWIIVKDINYDREELHWKVTFSSTVAVVHLKVPCIAGRLSHETTMFNSLFPRGWGWGVLGSIFAGYVPLASQNPYPFIVYFMANYETPS